MVSTQIPTIDELVTLHGEEWRTLITSAVKFLDEDLNPLVTWPMGRASYVREVIRAAKRGKLRGWEPIGRMPRPGEIK